MSSAENLRSFVSERLTAAAEEILGVFHKVIVNYEEEIDRQRRLLDIVRKPDIKLHRIELPQQHVYVEEVLTHHQLSNQEMNSSLDQEDSEPPQMKEEQEDLCSQEGEQLVLKQETDTFMLTPVSVENDHSEDQTLDLNPDETLEQSVVNMQVKNSVVSDPNSDLQLFPNSCHVAEDQDQKGGKHEDSRSARNTEAQPKTQQHITLFPVCSMLDPCDLIREDVLSILPSIPGVPLDHIVEKLVQQGVQIEEDLQYVREQDIEEILKPIQCRKLLDAWKHKERLTLTTSAPTKQMPSSIPLDQASSLSSSSRSSPASPLPSRANWPNTFEVNWEKMPPSLRRAVQSGKRPSPADRRQMVRILVDDIQKIEVNPCRAQCLIIARDITRQYPQSFLDTMDDGTTSVGAGYESLLCQIKTRVEHLNRNNTLARRRASKRSSVLKQRRGPADRFGCTQWQPDLPPEETVESMQKKRQKLMEIFSRDGSSGMERAEVSNLMESTYYLQRQMINANPAPALEDVKKQWPYLFFPRSMCAHFELLTGIPIVRKIKSFLEGHGRNIMEFFKQNPTNDNVKNVLFNFDCIATASNILQVLMAHFKEPFDALVIQTDASSTPAIVQLTMSLPDTPRLIMAETTQHWMLSAEKEVLCEGTSSVLGLAVLFASYYNFNLQYQHDAACTLEFIQRTCMDINPERGTKVSQDKVQSKRSGKMVTRKATSMNPHVSTLIKRLSDFKWGFV